MFTIAAILLGITLIALIVMWQSIKNSPRVPCNYYDSSLPGCENCKDTACKSDGRLLHGK